MRFIKILLIPHDSNKFHPHSTRYYTLLIYSILFLVANFFIFPTFGITSGKVLASNLETNEIITLTNTERINRKISPLRRNSLLDEAAIAKGNDMLKKQYWGHYGPNGESPWQFILDKGYDYIYAGENLAKDFSSSREVVNAWMHSPTHKANILNTNFNEIGLGIVSGKLHGKFTIIIVQIFGYRHTPTITLSPQLQVDQIESYKPSIYEPTNNSILNTYSINISGESNLGDSILIYVNDKVIGEIPINGGLFSSRINLTENKNILQVQAKDTKNSSTSQKSDIVNLNIDTISPDISEVTIELFDTNRNQYTLITKTNNEEINRVIAKINGEEILLSKYQDNYFLNFNKGPEKIILNYYDIAGNYAIKEIDLINANIKKAASPIVALGTDDTPTQSYINWTFANKSFGLKDIINIFFIFSFLGLIALDAGILLKKSHIREWTSHHSFHISLILFVSMGVLLI